MVGLMALPMVRLIALPEGAVLLSPHPAHAMAISTPAAVVTQGPILSYRLTTPTTPHFLSDSHHHDPGFPSVYITA